MSWSWWMKFKPGDIAWVRHWEDGWNSPTGTSEWFLAAWDGIEQVVTVLEYTTREDGTQMVRLMNSDGSTFITWEDYLVDKKEADSLRRMNK